ncbi:segregation/condensation protein A [Corynebacterium sp. ES2794-CONJ1]|uniref:segregation and condensation protein A n=1 Tax=Corynebacterium sp. ES2794-CONJ1 TaxID=2980553 RepID=UPI0021DA8472|nr:ScpA family protein [Corynebacterium sp. ES2794-CONJ1]MCU9518267.1 segregation/condensation protein A [Corynebacterium sp. ES2794-CONJ1]
MPTIPHRAVQPEITGFRIVLNNFEGPFDLLLQLISARKMDITDIALATVTDDFVEYTKQLGEFSGLDEVTEFLVVAATLLDLKAARLLPRGQVEEDIEYLELRDLLFARLLQYQAYQKVAEELRQWQRQAQLSYPHALSMDPQFVDLLAPVNLGHTRESFAEFAASVFRPKPAEEVATAHIHHVSVSVPEQAGTVLQILHEYGPHQWVNFSTFADSRSIIVVGRFLALLELYKARAILMEQDEPLEDLRISWTGLDVDPAVVAASTWE